MRTNSKILNFKAVSLHIHEFHPNYPALSQASVDILISGIGSYIKAYWEIPQRIIENIAQVFLHLNNFLYLSQIYDCMNYQYAKDEVKLLRFSILSPIIINIAYHHYLNLKPNLNIYWQK